MISIITVVLIFGIAFLIRKLQNQRSVNDLEKLKFEKPSDENNFTSPANREFQNVNLYGLKVTWIFNEDATKVQIKGGMFGFYWMKSTLSITSMGFGRFKARNGSVFTLEGNCIKSGHVYLIEIPQKREVFQPWHLQSNADMKKSKVDMFIWMNIENFSSQDIIFVKDKLEKLEDDKFLILQGTEFQKPSTIFLIAILLGWERFWLNDVALGIVKIITFYGCMVWWIVDIISAKKRAKEYNIKKFIEVTSYI